MTKPMDKRQVLASAFYDQLTEALHHYNMTEQQRQVMVDAKIEVNDWENMTPALPMVTWEVAGHKEGMICLELMGRNRAPIKTLGRAMGLRCYRWIVWMLRPDEE